IGPTAVSERQMSRQREPTQQRLAHYFRDGFFFFFLVLLLESTAIRLISRLLSVHCLYGARSPDGIQRDAKSPSVGWKYESMQAWAFASPLFARQSSARIKSANLVSSLI